ncbi:hypothetical protein CHS0354_001863 [Potamilus streckersoni]|uniref:Uncharacterized protein n=1 Tax=Potamilus streckersoni TaxID=2493646 RepID=A0AAE0S7J3_9BIVA|nr:hypothetical protein CHS0354_001863 [Potamilus streckersoni]
MTSNFLSTLDLTVNLRHPDTGTTATGGTDNGGNPGDTQPIPEGSPTPSRSLFEYTTSKKLFTNAGENEAENSEFERVLVSTDGVFYENQADDIRSNLEDLRTVWSQETISITPKKHSNGFAELMKQVREFKADSHKNDEGEPNRPILLIL